jgi:hypothetical protein
VSLVSEIITQDQIQDLWGCGFTIVARKRGPDPFHVPQEMVPQGRSYQWWHLVHDKFHFDRPKDATPSGWAAVPASRHDGYFMPFGHTGDIEVNGLGLFEKSKVEVDQERAKNVVAAHKQVEDWIDKNAGLGLSGGVRIGDVGIDVGDQDRDIFASSKSKTLETTVKIPKDMVPYMAAIFTERDRLKDEAVVNDVVVDMNIAAKLDAAAELAGPDAARWPILHAILLPIAIENVRKTLRAGEPNSDVNVHPDRKDKP